MTAFALLLAACGDRAKPSYSACVVAAAQGSILKAATACEDAIAADATSESGKAAAAKLTQMQPKIQRAKAELAAVQAKAAEEAAQEAAARVQAKARVLAERIGRLRVRVKKRYYSYERDGACTGKGLPPYRCNYEGGTYAEDQEVAEADQCVKLFSSEELQDYCCPEGP